MRLFKRLGFILCMLMATFGYAQKPPPLPHGMVFGDKPAGIAPMEANRLEGMMGNKIRITTAIRGKIMKVTNPKGGWFNIDAGKGRTIEAHFKNVSVNLPTALRGRTVIIEGVAQRKLLPDDLQHYAGDTVGRKKGHTTKVDPKNRITFEVRGLFVDQ